MDRAERVIVGLGAAVFAGSAFGQEVAVQDPGFEGSVMAACNFGGFHAGSPWVMTGTRNGGAWRPGTCWDIDPAEGLQVGYSNSGWLEQTVTEAAIPGAEYTLTVMVGRRNHVCCPAVPVWLELWAGDVQLGSRVVPVGEAPPPGSWRSFTMSCTASGGLASGLPLRIRMRAEAAQADFDAVRLRRGRGCSADFNGDGFVDFFDYDDYVNCFETGVCPPGMTADVNGDGFADFFDYDDFVRAFEVGC